MDPNDFQAFVSEFSIFLKKCKETGVKIVCHKQAVSDNLTMMLVVKDTEDQPIYARWELEQ